MLLEISGLHTQFGTRDGVVNAVDGVDLAVPAGTTVCLVGESGSGKSVTARSVLGLIDPPGRVTAGHIWWHPNGADGASANGNGNGRIDLAALDPTGIEIRRIRGPQIAMVFQEPMASLSPMYTVGDQLAEMLRLHRGLTGAEARDEAIQLLRRVGIPRPDQRVDAYSFQLSGGMCQRVMIAMALSCGPSLLIADEPTTALDVTIQARILDLFRELQQDTDMAVLFITHDLGVVAEIADEVSVMNAGRIVEHGQVEQIFADPQHPYTRSLLASMPRLGGGRRARTPREGGSLTPGQPPTAPSHSPSADGGEAPAAAPLLEVRGLRMLFPVRRGTFGRTTGHVHAVDGVDLTIRPGETLGLVGESGCGKTSLGRCIVRSETPTSGQILYRPGVGDGDSGVAAGSGVVDLAALPGARLRPYQRDVRLIFQDPFSALNPRMTLRQIIGDPLIAHRIARGSELTDRVAHMLSRVGLSPDHMDRYPHAFSGGQRQRVNIARALILEPRLVIADEAVSALDVSIRGQILDLLRDLQDEYELTYLFISHDLSVVESICDRVAVMYLGKIVELADTAELYENPRHPYTEALLSAVPLPDPRLRDAGRRIRLADDLPDPTASPPGCYFHTRCPHAVAGICDQERPALEQLGPAHQAACLRTDELRLTGVGAYLSAS